MKLSVEEIREILQIFRDSQMQDLHIEVGDTKVLASKRRDGAACSDADAAESTEGEPLRSPAEDVPESEAGTVLPDAASHLSLSSREGLVEVTAPLLGTFYRCPAPGQPPFVDIGSDVEPQDPVCIVEVMKLFNHVTVGKKGRIVDIVVEDGAMVEFGQTLMWVEPVGGAE